MKRAYRVFLFIALAGFCSPAVDAQASIDTLYTDVARYIAGKPLLKHLKAQARHDFYQTHQTEINQAWRYTETHDLLPMAQWRKKQQIGQGHAGQVVFYPFSGPDFAYVHRFFPDAREYVMGGLESCGSIPPLYHMSATELKNYLSSLRYSFRYMNKVGYFVTKQMLDDFQSDYLNGAIHILLYYLAQTGHHVGHVKYFTLTTSGEPRYVTAEKVANYPVSGLEIRFAHTSKRAPQIIRYFRMDLSDKNMRLQPAFRTFLKKRTGFLTYMKSASYILHNEEFSLIRDDILTLSQRILQDDTGIPYNKLKESPRFQVELFGQYTQTIADFTYRFQPELKTDLDATSGNNQLPFTIGYNTWHDETILMYAYTGNRPRAQSAEPTKKTKTRAQVRFKVQVFMSQYKKSPQAEIFKGLETLDFYLENGMYKYTVGNVSTYEQSVLIKQKVRNMGFQDAFVVAFSNGRRIPVKEALQKQ